MTILLAMLAVAAGSDLGALVDRLDACLIKKTDQFAPAHEPADVTVEAAYEACLAERADLRVGLQEFAKTQGLTPAQAKEVERSSYETAISAARGRALVRLMSVRAANASN